MTCALAATKRLREYTANFDKVDLADFRVTAEEIEAAVAAVEPEFLDAIAAAAGAIEDFHKRQLPQSWFTAQEGGVFLGQKVTPIRACRHLRAGRAREVPVERAHERDPGDGGRV